MATLTMTADSFTVSLGNSAHQRADQYCQQHTDLDKAEAVYLNTLSVWAVEHYLRAIGYTPELTNSDSSSLLMQMVTDSAGLMLPNFGQVECRPIERGETTMAIPPETWGSRIAYIAVQVDDDLEEATLLGFVPKTMQPSVALAKLRPLADLTAHLNQFERIDLAAWWENSFQPSWEAIAQLLRPDQWDAVPAMRSRQGSPSVQRQEVERGCKMTIGDRQLALVMNLQQSDVGEYDICIKFWPVDTPYLPPGLHLSLLDEDELPVLEAHSKDNNETIEMTFKGERGDGFSVRMMIEDVSLTREFLL